MNTRILAATAALGIALGAIGCAKKSGFSRLSAVRRASHLTADGGGRGGALAELTEKSALADYLAYAALNNPGLEASFNRWKAAVERVPQVRSLPDPRFTYQYYIREVETRVGAMRQSFTLAQMFPWFGKLALRGDAATEAARAQQQVYEGAKLKLFYQVTDAYYEYYYLRQAIGVVEENIGLVKNAEAVARARFKVGAARHPDVIRAQVELGKLEDRLETLQDLRVPVVARLNAALNRPPAAPLPWPGDIVEQQFEIERHQDFGLAVFDLPLQFLDRIKRIVVHHRAAGLENGEIERHIGRRIGEQQPDMDAFLDA